MTSSRRNFAKSTGKIALFAGGLSLTNWSFVKNSFGKESDLPLLDEKSQIATALKYHADASKVPATLRVAKAGTEGSKQRCDNCLFYAKAGKNKGEEVGKCQLFPQGHVPAKAWCVSWALKPK
jgi:hypothetical protein